MYRVDSGKKREKEAEGGGEDRGRQDEDAPSVV